MALNEKFSAFMTRAGDVAQAAAKKANEMAAIAKAKASILAEEDKIKKAHQEIGKLYYADFLAGKTPDPAEYLPWCDKVSASRTQITVLKQQIADLKATEETAEETATEEDFADSDVLPEIEIEVVDEKPTDSEEQPPAE